MNYSETVSKNLLEDILLQIETSILVPSSFATWPALASFRGERASNSVSLVMANDNIPQDDRTDDFGIDVTEVPPCDVLDSKEEGEWDSDGVTPKSYPMPERYLTMPIISNPLFSHITLHLAALAHSVNPQRQRIFMIADHER